MKKTSALRVWVTMAMDREHLVMHPNDGFELGLMRITHSVRLCRNVDLESYLKGSEGDADLIDLQLLNECPPETIQIGKTLHRLLGEPERAIVLFDGLRLYLHRVP